MLKLKNAALIAVLLIPAACFEVDGPKEFEICDPCTSPMSYDGYSLVFNDEFQINTLDENWDFETGDGCPNICGWGGGELQFYQEENVTIRNGNLVITAKKEQKGTSKYTSGRISTFGSQSFGYGRIDIRAKFPAGKGLWPAFWLLGNNISEVGWPKAGQINLAEMNGGIDKGSQTIIGNLIWNENNSAKFDSQGLTISSNLNDKFHVYSIIWDQNGIEWLFNNHKYFEHKFTAQNKATFGKTFHLLINLAVGGDHIGEPDESTVFPQELEVDYIRFFEKVQ